MRKAVIGATLAVVFLLLTALVYAGNPVQDAQATATARIVADRALATVDMGTARVNATQTASVPTATPLPTNTPAPNGGLTYTLMSGINSKGATWALADFGAVVTIANITVTSASNYLDLWTSRTNTSPPDMETISDPPLRFVASNQPFRSPTIYSFSASARYLILRTGNGQPPITAAGLVVNGSGGATATPIPATAITGPTATPTGGTLLFDDEFDGTILDTSKWTYGRDADGLGGADQAYDPAALSVSGGMLHITAAPIPTNGKPYRSGAIWTQGVNQFASHYGYWEMRARVPPGMGMWPAFWGVDKQSGGPLELDVMEMYLGTSPALVDYNVHWPCGGRVCDNGFETQPDGDLTQGFHTFAMDWRADHVAWYVDGVEQWRQTSAQAGIPSTPFVVIVQLAVGSAWNNQHGQGETAVMDVDYIRVYA